ncbi:MAG: LysR family transcriptional regulator [Gemmatimonadaceae bacterium]
MHHGSRSSPQAHGAPAASDLDTLVVFAIVARERSLTRAADVLGISQPSVSGRIRRLERRLGEPLFERLGRGVRLTPAGELLRTVADRALEVAHATDELVDGLAGHSRGLVRGAASTTIAGYVLPIAIARLRSRHPGIEVDVLVGNTAEVAELVEQGEVPWGLVEGPVDAGRFTVRPFATDELLVVVPASHPWARIDRLPPTALADQPFVGREPGSGTGAIYDAALAAVGVRLRPHVRLAHSRGIAAAIAAGGGIGIVSAIVAAPFLASGQLARVTLDGLDLSRPLSTIQLPGRTPGRLDVLLIGLMGAVTSAASAPPDAPSSSAESSGESAGESTAAAGRGLAG